VWSEWEGAGAGVIPWAPSKLQDMSCHKCADIVLTLLGALNSSSATVHILKVKSHQGVQLNEEANQAAGEAAKDQTTLFKLEDYNPLPFVFPWWAEGTRIVL
jgi:hypothetical protein